MNDIVIKIGELLVRAGIVTGVDLSEAEKLAKHMNLQFGQVLIMSGCLSEHDLDCALVAQQLIREELLTVDIACQALAVASQHQMPFEDALEALSVVPKYGAASVEMAELLADAGIIPGELLEQALMTSLAGNVSLGELLVKENAISSALIPALNMMLADISSGDLQEEHAINEIRKHHFSWQRSQSSPNHDQMTQSPIVRTDGPAPAPVFVSQELMHAYEIYQPQQQNLEQPSPPVHPHPAQTHQDPHQVSHTNSQSYAGAMHAPVPAPAPVPTPEPTPAPAPHSIHDVLSMFQQRNPLPTPPPEGATPAVPREQQAASWTAFVQSQSFDPNDVESSVPPMAAAEEPRLRSLEEPNRSLEVVQGTYAKTFDGKPTELLPETFEPVVPPDFEPAAEVIADTPAVKADAKPKSAASADGEEEEDDEQFSLLVELLIESTYFDREDIIEAITNALKEESKAVKLIEMLGLADARAIMAASICADALRKNELTSGEAVTVLGDIKGGAEIHEALESVNLELAVTVSANLQMMYDDEVDETFYVGDVSRTVDIFEVDDFVEEPKHEAKKEVALDVAPPPVVDMKDETPPIAFGYGRERLKIAKRTESAAEEKPALPHVPEPLPEPVPIAAKAPDRPQTTIGGKKVSSLSEVFEKLSGVEGNGAPVAPLPTPVAKAGSAPPTAAAYVRPGFQTSDNKAHRAADPPPSVPVPPVVDQMPAPPIITPVVDQTPAPPTITPVVDQTPAPPTITPVVDQTPAPPTITPVVDQTSTPPIPPAVAEPTSAPTTADVEAISTPTTTLVPDSALSSTDAGKTDDEKKAARKKNSTTFNSLQAVFVPAAEALVTVSNEASSEYAAYVSTQAASADDKLLVDLSEHPESGSASAIKSAAEEESAEKESVSESVRKEKSVPEPVPEEESAVDEPEAAKKKPRPSKAKIRGGAKEKAATAAPPKKTKRRK